MARKLTQILVDFISLVKHPANKNPVILKNDGMRVFKVIKSDKLLHRVYGIVYEPEKLDTEGDYADAEEILKAASEFMRSNKNLNIDHEHDYKQVGAFVAESWIVRSGDPLFPEQPGAWAVGIQIEDPELWEAAEKGEIAGLSMAGGAMVEEAPAPSEKSANIVNQLIEGLAALAGLSKGDAADDAATVQTQNAEGDEVEEEKINALIAEQLKPIQEAISALQQVISGNADDTAEQAEKSEAGEPVTKSDLDSFKKSMIDLMADHLAKSASESSGAGTDDDEPGLF